MNRLFSNLKAYWQQIFTSAAGRHAQLYYRRAMESYNITIKQWKNFELIEHDNENLVLALNYFRSTKNDTIAKEIAHVSLALQEQILLNRIEALRTFGEQALSKAEETLPHIDENSKQIDDLLSRINQTMAKVESIADFSQTIQEENDTTELSDKERKD